MVSPLLTAPRGHARGTHPPPTAHHPPLPAAGKSAPPRASSGGSPTQQPARGGSLPSSRPAGGSLTLADNPTPCPCPCPRRHLNDHPQVLSPSVKEPHFFRKLCNEEECPEAAQARFVEQVLRLSAAAAGGQQQAAFEASATYAKNGQDIAAVMAREMPWLRVAATLREPISQIISRMRHHEAHEERFSGEPCLWTRPLYDCLVEDLNSERCCCLVTRPALRCSALLCFAVGRLCCSGVE